MTQKNIWFRKNADESYDMVVGILLDFLDITCFYYYDIDVKKLVLFKRGHNEYIIRYYDVNKMADVPLQLKIKFFFGRGGELRTFTNNHRVIPIHSHDKKP